jgi:hypothetical protein
VIAEGVAKLSSSRDLRPRSESAKAPLIDIFSGKEERQNRRLNDGCQALTSWVWALAYA